MEKPKVLMVDDDKNLGEQVKRTLEKRYEVFLSEDGRDILHIIQRRKPHVVLLDLHLPPDITSTKVGMDILRDLVDTKIESKVIVITGSNDRKDALTAIDMGVYDYINKPIDIDELEVILKRAVHIHRLESEARSLQQRLGKEYVFEGIVGSCPQMQQIFTIIRRVAPTNSTVLLQGETGTGKELIARAIHQQSFRKEGPFIVINCAAIPDSLLESELFGHERGSFTGAFSRKLGTIELAQGGTLFMDEIAELPLPLQPKLLRFLQGSEIQRIGGKEKIKADVRVIAASNRYLEEAVRMGSFRKDLYYRLKLIVIELPPLRDRGNDILLLAEHFLKRMNNGLRVKRLTSGAKRALMQFIIIPFILITVATTIIYWKMPKTYRSDTLILVLPQKVPKDYVRPTVTTPVAARLRTITEEILSRTRLETIITQLNLYPEVRKRDFIDQAVEEMRKDIEIKVKGNSSFRIYYQNQDPETARAVTSRLASLFIEENLKTREQQARVTTDFLSKELASARKKLEEQEKAITEFKFQHIGNLPQQNKANLAMLGQLAEQRQMISQSIARAEDKRLLIQQQLAGTGQFLDDGNATSLQAQLQAAKNRLFALKSTYTDNHIEVRKVQAQIRQLEDRLKSVGEEVQDEVPEGSQTIGPMALDLKNQLMVINKEIERLKKEEARINQQIALYQKRLEEAPRVELQLQKLTRDYNNTRGFYEDLLRKKMQAEQAENLERRQQGEQFKILDPASLPRIPYKPNPKKVFPIGILLGLGAGCGLAFLAEMLDKSFRNVKEVEEYLGVPVLAAIPLIKKQKA